MQPTLLQRNGTATPHPTPTTAPNLAPLPPTADLDPLRLRLVQLIDAVTVLHSQLAYLAMHTPTPSTSHPGLLPFPELVARYHTLLTHLAALQGLLSSEADQHKQRQRERNEGEQGGAAGRRRRLERERDPKREKWDSLSVVPCARMDEAQDWRVGALLRTKQTPDFEQSQANLLQSLPEPFASSLLSVPPTVAAAEDPPRSTTTSFGALAAAHARLVSLAYDRVLALQEFNSENEEWDWKARVELDEDALERERREDATGTGTGMGTGTDGASSKNDNAMQVDVSSPAMDKPGAEARPWTAREVQAYLRTGQRPVR